MGWGKGCGDDGGGIIAMCAKRLIGWSRDKTFHRQEETYLYRNKGKRARMMEGQGELDKSKVCAPSL